MHYEISLMQSALKINNKQQCSGISFYYLFNHTNMKMFDKTIHTYYLYE